MRQLKISKSITSRDTGTLDKYLTEIGREEMITAEEEVILARRIREGDDAALERLVRANLRFVVSVAKQYQNQGLTLADLINEGNLGLIKAARRFDETRGFKFISYAVWWIRQSIMQAIADQSRMIRLPLNQLGTISRIKKVSSRLEQEYERRPSVKEIADKANLSEEKVEIAMNINMHQISVDAPTIENDDISFLDTYVDDREKQTDHDTIRKSSSEEIRRILSVLNERERKVLMMYYGIGYDHGYTLEEIGHQLGYTRERIRQIKDRALKKLKTRSIRRKIFSELE